MSSMKHFIAISLEDLYRGNLPAGATVQVRFIGASDLDRAKKTAGPGWSVIPLKVIEHGFVPDPISDEES